jgi:hypothetical protein
MSKFPYVPTYEGYKQGKYHTPCGSEGSGGQAAQDGDEEAEELQELTQQGGKPLVYQRWIQLQVTQWATLDILLILGFSYSIFFQASRNTSSRCLCVLKEYTNITLSPQLP